MLTYALMKVMGVAVDLSELIAMLTYADVC
jgi:hypothetical protein